MIRDFLGGESKSAFLVRSILATVLLALCLPLYPFGPMLMAGLVASTIAWAASSKLSSTTDAKYVLQLFLASAGVTGVGQLLAADYGPPMLSTTYQDLLATLVEKYGASSCIQRQAAQLKAAGLQQSVPQFLHFTIISPYIPPVIALLLRPNLLANAGEDTRWMRVVHDGTWRWHVTALIALASTCYLGMTNALFLCGSSWEAARPLIGDFYYQAKYGLTFFSYFIPFMACVLVVGYQSATSALKLTRRIAAPGTSTPTSSSQE